MSKMLNAHPNIYCTENRLFGNYADFIQDDGVADPRLRITLDKYVSSISLHLNSQDLNLSSNDLQKEITAKFIRSLLTVYNKHTNGKRIVDKITPYLDTASCVCSQIQEYFPNAKKVYLLRDGRDVCTSGVFHWLKKHPANQTYTDFAARRRSFFLDANSDTLRLNRFFADSEIEEWAQTWVQPLASFYFSQPHKIYLIRYEDMLSNLENVLSSLFSFMALDNKPDILSRCIETGSFSQMSDGRSQGKDQPGAHVRKGVRGDWKNYFTQRDGEIFDQHAGKYLIEMGYESDPHWFKKLPPDLELVKNGASS